MHANKAIIFNENNDKSNNEDESLVQLGRKNDRKGQGIKFVDFMYMHKERRHSISL
jgi:hypothetical protein